MKVNKGYALKYGGRKVGRLFIQIEEDGGSIPVKYTLGEKIFLDGLKCLIADYAAKKSPKKLKALMNKVRNLQDFLSDNIRLTISEEIQDSCMSCKEDDDGCPLYGNRANKKCKYFCRSRQWNNQMKEENTPA